VVLRVCNQAVTAKPALPKVNYGLWACIHDRLSVMEVALLGGGLYCSMGSIAVSRPLLALGTAANATPLNGS
jgi:hypothetical protein